MVPIEDLDLHASPRPAPARRTAEIRSRSRTISSSVPTSGTMISGRTSSPACARARRRRGRWPPPASRRSRARSCPSRQPRWPSMGLLSARASARAWTSAASIPICRARRCSALSLVRQELVERRIEQPDRDRQPGQRLEDALEVLLLHGQQMRRAPRAAPPRPRARIIRRTQGMRSSSKNMCSVRQRPMPSAPRARATRRVVRRVGVGAHRAAGASSSAAASSS